MGQVVVVGSYIAALVMDTDELPLEGQTVFGCNFHVTHGGKGSNMAVAAARLGAETAFIGKIGKDDQGDAFLDLLNREGVAATGVMRSESAPTATGIILFTRRGTNAIVIDRGANGALCPEDIESRWEAVARDTIVLSPLEIPLDAAQMAAKLAQMHGGKAILNPAPAQDLRQVDLSPFFALTPNETEARTCLGLPADDTTPMADIALRLHALGVPHVIVTLGAAGALWASGEGVRHLAALPVAVVDTVGAGDAFNAGLAVGLAEGASVEDAIRLGIVTASLSTEQRETIESYPTRELVKRHLNSAVLVLTKGETDVR